LEVPGSFHSPICDWIIRSFTKGSDVILDPMCGSGVLPIEAYLKGRKAYGYDVDPLSILMCKAKSYLNDLTRLRSEIMGIRQELLEVKRSEEELTKVADKDEDDVIDENPGLPDERQSAFDTTISKVTGQSYKAEGVDYGIKCHLDIQRLLKPGKVNVFNFKTSSEEDYRSSTLYILSELFKLKKGAADNINSLPKVLIMIEEAHIPFSNETENYLGDILMDVAKKIFKIGRHVRGYSKT
jgi:hypothetical protein